MPPMIGDGVYVPIGGGVRGCGRGREAVPRDGRTALRQGEEGGGGPAQRGVDGLTKEERRGGQTNSEREEGLPPATREAGPGTPGRGQETRSAEMAMVTLDATALKGGGNSSDTPEQQQGSPPLHLGGRGGGTFSDTTGQQNGGPPASNVAMLGGTREEGGLTPWRRGETQSSGQHRRRRRQRRHMHVMRGEGEVIILSKTMWMQKKILAATSPSYS